VNGWDPATSALLTLLPQTARGPKRGGIFALWLTLRVAQDLLLDPPPVERAHRRRVQALEHRLSSLTIPPPLRRALATALSQLREARPETAAQVLSQLVAPARESGGSEAGEALALAARQARQVVSGDAGKRGRREAGKMAAEDDGRRGRGGRETER
jgi:hypothetical protein